MSLHLIYIGPSAALAPAGSLRALADAGALFVPSDLETDLLELIAGASTPNGIDGQVRPAGHEADPGGSGSLSIEHFVEWARAQGSTGVVFCVAGRHGPEMARSIQSQAERASVEVKLTPSGSAFADALIGQDLVALRDIITILRRQCPWDRVQTAPDIISYTIEEVYELADTIADGDVVGMHGELGDLLMQVYFLAQLLEEQRRGDVGTVAEEIEAKLIRRHAHIFGEAVAETAAEVRGVWERVKREQEGREGVFHDVPAALPALLLARKLQERAAAVGFDWDTVEEAFPKIAEEHGELAEVLELQGSGQAFPADAGPTREVRLLHEVGDLLFAVINVARKAGADPELALREAARRFQRRVNAAVELAQREGKDWSTLELAEQEAYYQRAKARESG